MAKKSWTTIRTRMTLLFVALMPLSMFSTMGVPTEVVARTPRLFLYFKNRMYIGKGKEG